MTRQECETVIRYLMEDIRDVYRMYNPNGRAISLYWGEDKGREYICANNRYWRKCEGVEEDGEDVDMPLNLIFNKEVESDE